MNLHMCVEKRIQKKRKKKKIKMVNMVTTPLPKKIKIKIGHLKFIHDFLINQFNLYAKQLTTSS